MLAPLIFDGNPHPPLYPPQVKDLDHGVLAVGYLLFEGNQSGVVWIKNSWGSGWGDGGYITFGYKADHDAGKCGMNLQATLPIGAKLHAPTPTPPPPPMCDAGGIFKPAFYCPYNTTCCCDHKSIFKKCVYTCCPDGASCAPHDGILGSTANATCLKATVGLAAGQ